MLVFPYSSPNPQRKLLFSPRQPLQARQESPLGFSRTLTFLISSWSTHIMAGEYNTYGSSESGNRGYGESRGPSSDRGGMGGGGGGSRGDGRGRGRGRGRGDGRDGRGDGRGDGRSRRPGIPLSSLDPNLTGFSHKVIGIATEIHTVLGPGFDEATYMTALNPFLTPTSLLSRTLPLSLPLPLPLPQASLLSVAHSMLRN